MGKYLRFCASGIVADSECGIAQYPKTMRFVPERIHRRRSSAIVDLLSTFHWTDVVPATGKRFDGPGYVATKQQNRKLFNDDGNSADDHPTGIMEVERVKL